VLLVGGCCEEALAVGASGAHVPSRMLGVRARVRGLQLVGASVHDESELRLAAKRGVDYATISPVFATSSKPNATALLGLDGVRRLLRATAQIAPELRLLGLGGVELPRIAELLGAGLWGVAAGTPFLTSDPGATFAEWRAAVESALA
jgi:thiamine-phosphate pyrophosphorylase